MPKPRPALISAHVRNLDAMLCQLAAARDRLVLPLARAARLFHDARGWTPFGFSRPDDFTRERLGRSAAWLRQLANVDRAVKTHAVLGAALSGADGGTPIGTAALLEIARVLHVAPPGETVDTWIRHARRLSLAQLRALVRSVPSARSFAPDVENSVQYTVRIMAPPDVLEAFEQTLDLHRAVAGRETGAVSFVDALCAEASSGAFPFDVPARRVQPSERSAEHGRGLHAETAPRDISLDTSALRRAAAALCRFADIERVLPPCSQPPAPARLQQLGTLLAELVGLENTFEVCIGELLADLDTQRPWKLLRFTSAAHYAEERLRMSRTTARDRIDAARGLRRLPAVERAYESGSIGLEKALLVLRLSRLQPVSAPAQREWAEHAEHTTLKRCRDEYRSIRWAQALQQSDPAGTKTDVRPLEDAAWQASIRRTPGQARAFVLDVGCRVLDREQAGRWSPVVCRPLRLPEDIARSFAAAVDAARNALLDEKNVSVAEEARLRPSVRIARLFAGKPTGVPAWVGLLALLEEYVMTWDAPESMPDRQRHAIFERDGYRCMSPGCTQRATLEAHHLRYRSNGGGNEADNLITLCAFHHRLGEHGMYATCTGTAPLDVLWGLGRAELRTWYRNEVAVTP